MKFESDDVQAVFVKISQEFVTQMPGKCQQLTLLAKKLKYIDGQFNAVQELYRLSHNIFGSARTFGIDDLAEKTLALTKCIYPLTKSDEAVVVLFEKIKIESLIHELSICVDNLQNYENNNEVNVCG